MLPARGGRGIFVALPAENGLFPAAGGRGIFVAEDAADEAGFTGVIGGTGVTGATGIAACASSICARVPSSSEASAAAISSGVGAAAFFAALFLAAAFFAGFASAGAASATALRSGNLSINLRTTGASTVEEAERTNSPTSWSLARSSLLSKPKSFANS
ncbi:unannotated protein [freshwater metagenome]|uniref:Unannotated protein n=1 Tax=freshwater metagenome TaxID=449393 RepID=A0A6J6B5F1_9ZZZZ